MTAVRIYHNPRCATSRKALALLRAEGVEPEIIPYLERPLSIAELNRLLKLLDLDPRALLRRREAAAHLEGFDDPGLSPAAILKAMAAHPILIERPIVVRGGRAVLARPAERALEVLKD